MPSRQLNLNISKTKLLFFPLNAVCLSFPISVRGCPMFLVSQAQRLCSHPGLLCSSHALHPIHRQILLAVTLAYIKNPSLSHYILCPHCGQVPTSHLDFCSGLWTGVPHPPWQSSLPSRQPSQAMTPLCSYPSRGCLYLIMAATLQKCCCTGSPTPPPSASQLLLQLHWPLAIFKHGARSHVRAFAWIPFLRSPHTSLNSPI